MIRAFIAFLLLLSMLANFFMWAVIHFDDGHVDSIERLTAELETARTQMEVRAGAPPTEQACVKWLFTADLAAAKARICQRSHEK